MKNDVYFDYQLPIQHYQLNCVCVCGVWGGGGGDYTFFTHFVNPPFSIKNDSTRGLIVDIGRKHGVQR